MQLFKLLNFKKLVCGIVFKSKWKKKFNKYREKEVKLGVHKADWLGIMFLTLKPSLYGQPPAPAGLQPPP